MRNVNVSTAFLPCRLTSAWRRWSSDSGRCWHICGTAARPRDLIAPASQTVAFAPSPSPSPPWAALSPSTHRTAHFRGYLRTQQPGTTSPNTTLCLHPSDWMQAKKEWKKLKCIVDLHVTHADVCSRLQRDWLCLHTCTLLIPHQYNLF